MNQARFIVPPYRFIEHQPEHGFCGQSVIEMQAGELRMFTHWCRMEKQQFNPEDPVWWQAPILRSRDGGRTWGDPLPMPLTTTLDGELREGGRGALLLPSGRILFVAHRSGKRLAARGNHGTPALSWSDDGGRSWLPARLLVKEDDIYYLMNQRLARLESGRLVLPICGRDPRVPLEQYSEGHACQTMCFLSEDDGQTWVRSRGLVRDDTKNGAQEPCVAETSADHLVMLCRGGRGAHLASFSRNGGDTWTAPQCTTLTAACSPLALAKLPDGRLMVVYDHATPLFAESAYPRRPLAYAISADAGRTWSAPVLIDDQEDRQLIYPSITPTREGIVVAYSVGYDDGTGHYWGDPPHTEAGGGYCCVIAYPD